MVEIRQEEVESIKLSVMNLGRYELAVNLVLHKSALFFWDCYCREGKKAYLLAALPYIQVYLELGFDYEDQKELFDNILRGVGTNRAELFPRQIYHAKKMPLTRERVRQAVGRWSSSKYQTMTKEAMVTDIIEKIQNKQIGYYAYHSNANPKGQGFDSVIELYIDENEHYLHRKSDRQYFVFIA